MIRWSMRPVGDDPSFTVATDFVDGRVHVVVNALDKSDEFLNFLEMAGRVTGPDLDHPPDLTMQQTAPGRYEGSFPARESGSYFIAIRPGPDKPLISAGINVPYSDEFRDRVTNEALLGQIANLAPKGGSAGLVIEAREGSDDIRKLLEINSFRHDLPKATSSQDVWYYLVLVGSCLFFFDVFVRRVQVSFAWAPKVAGRVRDFVLRREPQQAPSETMDRLRSRKAEVAGQLDQIRETARFEATTETPVDVDVLDEAAGGLEPGPARPAAPGPTMTPAQQPEEESYTSRLLKAKKKVWEDRKEK
jgi:hypothetical protein